MGGLMANYTSKHTGEEIDAAVSQVAFKITAPESANGGDHLIYDADTQTWIAAPAVQAEHTIRKWTAADIT
jgi:hypothetical protein